MSSKRGVKRTSSGASASHNKQPKSTFLGVYVSPSSGGRADCVVVGENSNNDGTASESSVSTRSAGRSRRSSSVLSTSRRDKSASDKRARGEDRIESIAIEAGDEDDEHVNSSDSVRLHMHHRYQSPTAPFKKKDKKQPASPEVHDEPAVAGTTSSDEEVFKSLTKDLKLSPEVTSKSSTATMTPSVSAIRGADPSSSTARAASEDFTSEDTMSLATTSASSCTSASTSPPPVLVPSAVSASKLPVVVKAAPQPLALVSPTKKTGIVIKLKLPTTVSPVASSSTQGTEAVQAEMKNDKIKWSKEIACHQDKVRSERPRMYCESVGCHHNYCERCVQIHYPDLAALFVPGGTWLCPVCRDVCTCQRCKGIRAGTVRRPVPKKRTSATQVPTLTSPAVAASSTPSTPAVTTNKKSRPGCERWMNTRGVASNSLPSGLVAAVAVADEKPAAPADGWAPPQERWSDSESEEDEEWREWSKGRTRVVWHEGPERRRRRKTLENEMALKAITEGKRFSPPKNRSTDNLFVMDVDERANYEPEHPALAIEFEPAALGSESVAEPAAAHSALSPAVRLASPLPAVRVEDFIPPSPDDDMQVADAIDEAADAMAVDEADRSTPPAVSAPENAANLEVTLMPPVLANEPIPTAATLESDDTEASKATQSTPSKVLRYALSSPGKLAEPSHPPPSYSAALQGDDPLIFAGPSSLMLATDDDVAPSSSKVQPSSASDSLREGLRGVSDEMLGSAVRRALLDIEAERSAAAAAVSSAIKSAARATKDSFVNNGSASAGAAAAPGASPPSPLKADVPSSVCENSLFSSGEVKFDDWILTQSTATRSTAPAANALVDWDLQ